MRLKQIDLKNSSMAIGSLSKPMYCVDLIETYNEEEKEISVIFAYDEINDVFKAVDSCATSDYQRSNQFFKKYNMVSGKYRVSYQFEDDWIEQVILDEENPSIFNEKLKELKIVFPQDYHCDESFSLTRIITNKTSLDDSIVNGFLDTLFRVKRVSYSRLNEKGANNGSAITFYFEDGEEMIRSYYSQRFYTISYTDDKFQQYLEDNFILKGKTNSQAQYTELYIPVNSSKTLNFAYVEAEDMLITIHIIDFSAIFEGNQLLVSAKETHRLEYEIGKPIKCIKTGRKEKDVTPFEMFKVNSKTIMYPMYDCIYAGAAGTYEFFMNSFSFFERCGFNNLISYYNGTINMWAAFIIFLQMMHQYPSIELLCKMGHANLVESIFNTLMQCGTKDAIKSKIVELSELLDGDATKGNLALRIPSYIADYLKQSRASLCMYLFWRNVYELDDLSKERFEAILKMPEMLIFNSAVSCGDWNTIDSLKIPDIIKYDGYTFAKTLKYSVKMSIKSQKAHSCIENQRYTHAWNIRNIFVTLADTLQMAEELGFELNPYPEDLYDVHNELSELYKREASKRETEIVTRIAEECKAVVDKAFDSNAANLPTLKDERSCVFPKTQQDFSQEGHNQNNCVAGYFSYVSKGRCIVFFVRKKDNLDTSYITVEVIKGGLSQVMYSNNRRVESNSDDYKYCQFVAQKLLNAYSRNEIHAFDKI